MLFLGPDVHGKRSTFCMAFSDRPVYAGLVFLAVAAAGSGARRTRRPPQTASGGACGPVCPCGREDACPPPGV